MSLIDFFILYGAKIAFKKSKCWHWTGCVTKKGYGVIRRDDKLIFAHVLMAEVVYGKKPRGFDTDHLCRNKDCLNPEHLEYVTHAENVRRGDVAKKHKYCKRGHKLVSGNLYYSQGIRSCKRCCLDRSRARYKISKMTLEESRVVID
jgi:hypothetical protein